MPRPLIWYETRDTQVGPPGERDVRITARKTLGRRSAPGRGRLPATARHITIVVALATLAAACGAPETPAPGSGPRATNAATAALLPKNVLELPSFDFETYERLLYQLRGTPVVVNIWASWCGPCNTEAPALADAAMRYGDEVQFLGVDIQDQRGPATTFSTEYQIPYPSVFNESGEIHDAMGFVGVPDTLFYGADGSIVATWSGPLTSDALRTNINRLVSG
jgi:thiol-disulfide isomerase/thioredoxin